MLLSTLIVLPLIFGFVVLFLPNDKSVRVFSLIGSTAVFLISLGILNSYDPSSPQIQLSETYPWIPEFGIQYFIGLDGISLWLVLLTTFLTPLTILASWNSINSKIKSFHISVLVLETAMLGAFVALDTILFYVFWELMLIPMYLLIGVWGGERRIYAAVKFFIFTMVGSVFMLVAILALMYYAKEQTGQVTANLLEFYKLKIPFDSDHFVNPQSLMFWAFALAFAIKVPMFPLHTWLPDAHVQAPTPGSVILAGVLLKMGTYGFLRFAMPLFPEATAHFTPVFVGLAVFGIVYGALVAMIQPDIKKLVAYSSVSHLGYVMLGLFVLNPEGVTGALYQMLNHGVSTGGLFLLVGMIYERTHSREISKYGGLAKVMPLFAIFFFLMTISSIAVPGTNGFIGEFLILLGSYKYSPWTALFTVTGVIWGAAYMLWMYKRVFFGHSGELVPEIQDDHGHGHGHDHHQNKKAHGDHHDKHPLLDLSVREISVLVPLVVLIFLMGILPGLFLDKSKVSIQYLLENKSDYNLTVKTVETEHYAGSSHTDVR